MTLDYLHSVAESDHLDRDERFTLRECACGRLIDDGAYAQCVRCHEAGGPDCFTPPHERDPEPSGAAVAYLIGAAAFVVAGLAGWGATVWFGGGV